MNYVAGEFSLLFVCFMFLINNFPFGEKTRFLLNFLLVMLYMTGIAFYEYFTGLSGFVYIGV